MSASQPWHEPVRFVKRDEFTLACSVEGPPRTYVKRARFVSPRTREQQAAVKQAVQLALVHEGAVGRWPLDARYQVVVRVYRKGAIVGARRGDCSNYLKLVEDAIHNGLLMHDDSQIVSTRCDKFAVESDADERTEVWVRVCEED